MRDAAATLFRRLQQEICDALEALEPEARFRSDRWTREGGGGDSRVLEDGQFLEKGGVNFSQVHGRLSPELATQLPGDGLEFWACGVSLVLHPRNPHVPTTHANFRMIAQGASEWFGGGADLTPYYPVDEDARHFHRTFKAVCDRHDPGFHPRFKRWCDEYFYLPHRDECRGVGGIFFDRLRSPSPEGATREHDMSSLFAFVRDAGEAFLPAYIPIAMRRLDTPYVERERDFQAVRRGRYVEFNLMHDRGTIFGLKTGGRIESILMSLPPRVQWRYDHRPEPGSPEARIYDAIVPRDWAGETLV